MEKVSSAVQPSEVLGVKNADGDDQGGEPSIKKDLNMGERGERPTESLATQEKEKVVGLKADI